MGLGLHARCAAGRVRSLRPVLFLLWTQSSRARSPSPGASRPQRVSERGRPQDPAHPCWPLALRQSRESGACGGSRSPGLCAWAWLQGSQDTRAAWPRVHGAGRVSCRAQLSGRACWGLLRSRCGGLLVASAAPALSLSSFAFISVLVRLPSELGLCSAPFRAAVCINPSATATCSPAVGAWLGVRAGLPPARACCRWETAIARRGCVLRGTSIGAAFHASPHGDPQGPHSAWSSLHRTAVTLQEGVQGAILLPAGTLSGATVLGLLAPWPPCLPASSSFRIFCRSFC